MKKPPFLASALKYATVLGWPVFPVKPRAKEPLTEHGFKDATTDESQIREWWKKWPNANIGVPTGVKFDVLDEDPRHGGDESRERLEAQHGRLPDTVQQQTGGDGRHYLWTPNGRPSGVLAPGLDWKAKGGYIVVAPSIHPSGKPYVWDGADKLENQKILDAPAWLRSRAERKERKVEWKLPAVIPDGEKHYTITSLAGTLRQREVPLEAAYAACRALRFESPVSDNDIRERVESIYSSACERPRPKRSQSPSAAAVVDLNRFEPSLDLLNGLAVWQGRISFTLVKRRGPMLIATTSDGVEIVWPTTADLGSFVRSQAIISDATSIWIPTPPHRQIRVQWEAAVHLLLQLAAKDEMRMEPTLKEEVRHLLRLMWRAAGQPTAKDSGAFIDFVRAVERSRRNSGESVPPCVFVAEQLVWVHVPSFRNWLSIPSLTSKFFPLNDIRNGLTLLGFEYHENLRRGFEGDSETMCVWSGPLEVLET